MSVNVSGTSTVATSTAGTYTTGTSTLATAREQGIAITVLGDVHWRVNGRSATGMTRTVKRLIAMLAGWPGAPVHRDRLVSAIWGKTVPSDAHNSLQGHVAACAVRSDAPGS